MQKIHNEQNINILKINTGYALLIFLFASGTNMAWYNPVTDLVFI